MEWSDKKILVMGGDLRLLYLADALKDIFQQVGTYALDGAEQLSGIEQIDSLEKALHWADIIVTPVPFTKDGIHLLTKDNTTILLSDFCEYLNENTILFGGNIASLVLDTAKQKNIVCHDFMKMEDIAVENAITTAEGAIAEAITLSTQNLNQENCLVLGYGRCAKAIAQRLQGMNGKVTIGARRESARADAIAQGYRGVPLDELPSLISEAQFIFNTIPSMVLDAQIIRKVSPDAVIIDIASAPGGTDFEACKKNGIVAKLSLGIPGRYSPKTSAGILLGGIVSSLKI